MWYDKFVQQGCIHKEKISGRPPMSAETNYHTQQAYLWSPRNSTCWASNALNLPQPSGFKMLKKFPCSLALINANVATYNINGQGTMFWILHKHNEPYAKDETFQSKTCVSGETRFLLCGKWKHSCHCYQTHNGQPKNYVFFVCFFGERGELMKL